MTKLNSDNPGVAHLGVVFAAGLLAGYVANLLIPEKTKEQLGESAKKFKDTVMDEANMEKVKSILPGKGADIIDLYMDTRSRIMDELSQAKVSWENVNKKKYSELVKKTLETLVSENKVPTEQLETLQKYLDNDYQTFRSSQKTV